MAKLTPQMQDALASLWDRQWRRLDKIVGDALVRRDLAVARPNPSGPGYQYRLPGPEPMETAPLRRRSRKREAPLLDWMEKPDV